eukprot:scaffold34924_cov41-Phaeocystis_antarctica.AAC.1
MLSPPLSVTAVRASPRRLSSDGGWLSSEMIGWAHGRCLTADSGCRVLQRRLRRHTQRVTKLWRVLRTCDVSACAARRVSLHFRASSRWAAERSGWCIRCAPHVDRCRSKVLTTATPLPTACTLRSFGVRVPCAALGGRGPEAPKAPKTNRSLSKGGKKHRSVW